ncbi:hypothetical protein Purlil1_7217 [Purpureocillium lilacinum]|uniref:Uncharacterized protein n=1 Tax=Purpureocillium lilacinum TaxID=33203 RepID=A0ABR0BY05_PURLI|nr:hypothetical protein Purlil1_7217 [Purpureocillium lilacinum]
MRPAPAPVSNPPAEHGFGRLTSWGAPCEAPSAHRSRRNRRARVSLMGAWAATWTGSVGESGDAGGRTLSVREPSLLRVCPHWDLYNSNGSAALGLASGSRPLGGWLPTGLPRTTQAGTWPVRGVAPQDRRRRRVQRRPAQGLGLPGTNQHANPPQDARKRTARRISAAWARDIEGAFRLNSGDAPLDPVPDGRHSQNNGAIGGSTPSSMTQALSVAAPPAAVGATG